jgi:hypothetical protein
LRKYDGVVVDQLVEADDLGFFILPVVAGLKCPCTKVTRYFGAEASRSAVSTVVLKIHAVLEDGK